MSCPFSLAHYGELLEAARAGGYRFAVLRPRAAGGRPAPSPRRRPLARGRARAGAARGRGGRGGDVLPDDGVGLLQPRLGARARGDRGAARARPSGRPARRLAATPSSIARFDPVVAWHNPDPEYMRSPVEGAVNVMQEGFFDPGHVPLRLEPALAQRLPARGARRGRVPLAPAADPPRDLGLRRRDDARVDGELPRRRPRRPPRAPPRRPDRPLVTKSAHNRPTSSTVSDTVTKVSRFGGPLIKPSVTRPAHIRGTVFTVSDTVNCL